MATAYELYEAGLFATLAYADYTAAMQLPIGDRTSALFNTLTTQEGNPLAFRDKFLTANEATTFVSKYELVDFYSEHDIATDFQAVVFRDLSQANRYVICFRGVEPTNYQDWVAGEHILLGTPELNPQVAALKRFSDRMVAQGIATFYNQIDVAGLSLGGYLAQKYALDYGVVSNGWTFNSPGLRQSMRSMPQFTHVLGAPLLDGFAAIATRTDSPEQRVFVQSDMHATSPIVTTLAVMRIFENIDSQVSINRLNTLFEASWNTLSATHFNVLNMLAETLSAPTGKPKSIDRMDLLNAVDNLIKAASQDTSPKQLYLLNEKSLTNIENIAAQNNSEGEAYRYALKTLRPFAITGLNYQNRSESGDLSIYDSTTDTGAITQSWINDRAKMLSWVLKKNLVDMPTGQAFLTDRVAEKWRFEDVATNTIIDINPSNVILQPPQHYIRFGSDIKDDSLSGGDYSDNLYGGGGNDTIDGGKEKDFLEGNAGNDSLSGGQGNDQLFGGDGDDTLIGGTEYDILKGSIGNDIYKFKVGDGQDIIIDSDNKGQIDIEGAILNGGKEKATGAGVWVSENKKIQYTLLKESDGSNTLVITGDGNRILVKKFTQDALGIKLDNFVSTPVTPSTRTIVGDLSPVDFDPTTPGIQTHTDDLGNIICSGDEPGRADTLLGSDNADLIQGLGGEDALFGKAGDDSMEGGTGRDRVFGNDGKDVLLGGADADILVGGDGDDALYSDSKVEVAQAIEQGRTQDATGQKGDWLAGGAGDDTIVAGADNDALAGGGGSDLLIGGAGNDAIWGDAEWVAQSLDWTVSTDTDGSILYQPVSGSYAPLDGAADVIYAGKGDDRVSAGTGNDVIYGEDGNDVLSGNDGNDLIMGGEGNDRMEGDGTSFVGQASVVGGDDYMDGGAGNDFMSGGDKDDELYGGDGNDTLYGDGNAVALADQGNDYLDGEAGDDQLRGFGGDDQLFGGDGSDMLQGDAGNDYLDGEIGNDQLSGGGNDDELYGGDGNDILLGDGDDVAVADQGSDYLDGGAGDDQLQGYGGDDQLFGGDGNDKLWGDAGNDYLDGEAGNDFVFAGAGDDILYGSDGNDELQGGSGKDTLDGGIGNDRLFGEDGDDSLTGGDGKDVISAGNGNDIVYGDAGADQLFGGAGKDTLWGGVGNDEIQGGDDADSLSGGSGDDLMFGQAGNDTLNGDAGVDQLQGGDGDDVLSGGDDEDLILGDAGADTLSGDAGNDELQGGADNDSLDGGEGNDVLFGQDGNDTLNGGAGNDTLQGDAGVDTYRFGRGGGRDVIFNRDDSGYDTLEFAPGILASDVYAYRSGNDRVYAIKGTDDSITVKNSYVATRAIFNSYTGTYTYYYDNQIGRVQFADGTSWGPTTAPAYFSGSSGNESSSGTIYGDTFALSSGSDSMYGGVGNDTYVFGLHSGKDTVQDQFESGNLNTVLITSGLTSADVIADRDSSNNVVISIKNAPDTLTISGSVDVLNQMRFQFESDGTIWTYKDLFSTPTEQSDYLAGTSQNETIDGLEGNDTIIGGGGSDTLNGGAGNDSITAYNGGATFIDGGDGDDIISVSSDGTYVVDGGNGNDAITNTGYGYKDVTLAGGAGNDTLRGSYSGRDTLIGGAGDDIYYISTSNWGLAPSAVVENADEGVDTVFITGRNSYTLLDNLENLILMSNVADGTGNNLNNVLTGNEYVNHLIGNDGDDTLNGAGGNDLLDGGMGNDTYLFARGSGQDTISGEADGTGALDKIVFAANVLPSDIYVSRNGNDLLLSVWGTPDQIRVTDYYVTNGSIEQVVFLANGAIWDTAGIQAQLSVHNPTAGNDLLLGLNVNNDNIGGLGGNDTIYGYAGNDSLDGGQGDDVLIGGVGSDTYTVDSVADTVIENANEGIDSVLSSVSFTLSSSVENLTLTGAAAINGTGNELDNILTGNSANNSLSGGLGNDVLQGGGGADTLIGGAGDDTYYVTSGSEIITENAGEGNDIVYSSTTYTLSANLETLVLNGTAAINGTGNAMDNVLVGNTANNILSGGAGNDTLDGSFGTDTLIGGTGNDTYYMTDSVLDVIAENANEGIDTVVTSTSYTLGANLENLTLIGNAALNGTGNTLNNVLTGNDGNNIMDGGVGADTLMGGGGNDTYTVDNVGDVVVENAGNDVDLVQSSVTYTLSANVENLTLTGTAVINGTGNALNNIITGNSGNNVLSGGAGDDTYIVTAGDTVIENANEGVDTVQSAVSYTLGANVENLTLTGTASKVNGTGNSLNNVIIGTTANNTLTGGAGNDTLNGGGGTDSLIGGTGNDYFIVDDSRDSITENANEGTDTVQAAFSYTLGTNLENLVLTGAATTGTGNAVNNQLTGNALDNTLNGAAGADTLIGGLGNDTYVVDNVGDVAIESANEGTDLVQSSVTYTLGANIENLTLTGTTAINGTGNNLNNTLTGNSAANVLTGGAGDDTYVVGAGDSVIELANEGTDLVQSSVTYTLGANLENLTLTGTSAINATGNALNNILTGNSGSNVLTGGLGDDIYNVGAGDTVIENANEGIDTVQSSATFTLGANVENLTLTGTSAINGTGNALNNLIIGNNAANVLSGGAGDDTYFVGAGDSVVEALNSGVDTVISDASFTLGANVENLTLTGLNAINGTGNASNNTLTGNAANNILDGGVGIDTMIGGLGDDTYIVDSALDVVVENAGEGNDTVQTTISYVSGGNVENITLLGTAAINATGDSTNNLLTGNSAANILVGGAGNDTLNGGGGNDQLIGGAGDDTYVITGTGATIVENINEGFDTVQTSANYVLDAGLENLTLIGTAINGTGNALDNVITGNGSNNVLDGGAGIDTLYGGAGNDTLIGESADMFYGGVGDDLYIINGGGYVEGYRANQFESGGGGIDTIQTEGSLRIYDLGWDYNTQNYTFNGLVENVTLTGTFNSTVYGNSSNNVLIGNSGNNWMYSFGGNDRLDGGAGNDTLTGGSGTCTLIGGAGNDQLNGASGLSYEGGVAIMSGGQGDDFYYVFSASDSVTENANEGVDTIQSNLISYTLGANLENLSFYNRGDTTNFTGTGNALNNAITGGAGSDVLSGLAGDDTLDGGFGYGVDTLIGGAGNDTYIVDSTTDVITEGATEGIDTVQSSVTYTLGSTLENLTLTGAASINGTGNSLNNILAGNSAANILTGGAGDDTYVIGSNDTIVENANEGTDTVQAGFTYTLGANLENLLLTGTTAINGTGNAANNLLTGNGANNVLDGGVGVDTMIGGAGNDTYIVDNSSDLVTENAAEGTDSVQSSVTYTLTANVENLTLTGSNAINGTGNALSNTMTGNAAANVLAGGQGDDIYIVDGLDTVVENANEGMDTVQSSVTYTLGANVENLTLIGSAAINGIGNALNNTLSGIQNGSANVLSGGLGDDTYIVNYNDTVIENASEGIDTVQSYGDFTLSANIENLTLVGPYSYIGTGNGLNNILTGNDNNNTLDGGIGADTMAGGKGNDVYFVDNAGDIVTENSSEGADEIRSSVNYTLSANTENLVLLGASAINGNGNELDNQLTGNSGANILTGGAGNDVLNGGAGADTLIGGVGNDTYVVDAVGDIVTEGVAEGTDVVQSSIASYTLTANVENLVLVGNNQAGFGNALDNVLNANDFSADTLSGGLGNDIYVIDAADTVIENAGEGTDTVQVATTYTLVANIENLVLTGYNAVNGTGNDLNNTLTGNDGANILSGGLGDDLYIVGAGDVAVENPGEGTDTVVSSVSYALGENLENLTLTGTADLAGTGNGGNNVLIGNAGNNMLDGQFGLDTMIGGLGDDTYVVGSLDDSIIENANEGNDTVFSTLDYTLGANLENLQLSGPAALVGTGNELNNVIIGNTDANTLIGNAGDDTLIGGFDADTMIGGTGNDTYEIDNAGDVIVENADEGIDTVLSRWDYVLNDTNLENLTLTTYNAIHGTGNALNNVLTGSGADNVLDGGIGADTMSGGAGDDTYIVDNVGDVVYERPNAGEGTDTVLSSVNFVLAAELENLVLTGVDAINGTGNSSDNYLIGNAAANLFIGGAGKDTLDGGAGADTLNGGDGGDTYVIDNSGDVIIESLYDYSIDTVQSSVSYALGAGLENLLLTGSNAINGTGNAGDNVLMGNAANNVLDGGEGADVMTGDTGDDTYIVDNANDWVGEYWNEGLDQVRSSITYKLAVNVESLVLTGTAAINGSGNAGDNLIVGNDASNILDGGAGIDILQGGGGSDTLTDVLGNGLLDGGAGDDTITSGIGNDFISGGAGNDTITTGLGADVIAFNRGDGMDVVNASAGADNTLSLGKGIKYADLFFQKSGNDLIMATGSNEQITFRDWYTSVTNHSVANLQMVIEDTSDYDPTSTNQINNNKIEQFNFDGLVAGFDQARVANSSLTSWSLSSALLDFHLGGSDTGAIGGDLAYQYAKNGSLSSLSMMPADALLSNPSFGTVAQNLQSTTALQDLSPRLL